MLDEAERSLHDALCVLSQTVIDSRVLLGGGWPEMLMAKEVDELARKTPGKKSHAIDAFSRALIAIPSTIADNAGLDSAELIAQLRAEHQKEGSTAGIDVISGSVSTEIKSILNLICFGCICSFFMDTATLCGNCGTFVDSITLSGTLSMLTTAFSFFINQYHPNI